MIFIVFVTYLLLIAIKSLYTNISDRWFYVNCSLIILFIGLRGWDTGSSDTLNYINLLLSNSSMYSADNVEIGFMSYISFLRHFVTNGTVFLCLSAFLSLAPLFYLIKIYSPNVHVSLLGFFIIVSVYIMYFVCMRQILGMSIQLAAIAFVLSDKRMKWIKFTVLSLVAFSIHNTAVIISLMFLLLYFLNIRRFVYIGLVVISLLCCALHVFDDFALIGSFMFDNLLGDTTGAFSRINYYMNVDFDASNSVRLLMHVTISTICICHALILNDERYNSIFTKMYLVGVFVNNMFYSFPEIYRTSGLFDVFGLVSIGFLAEAFMYGNYKTWCKQTFKPTIKIIVAMFVLYAYYSFSANCLYQQNHVNTQTNATLIPYEFFWEDRY